MKVNRFLARNFQILKEIALEDLKAFNVFIGPNAFGKSTVLQALDFVLESGASGSADRDPNRETL